MVGVITGCSDRQVEGTWDFDVRISVRRTDLNVAQSSIIEPSHERSPAPMSDPGVVVDSIAVWLTHPNGSTVHPVAVSWESHVNDSIHWTADLAAPIAIDWADDAAWTLHVKSLAGLFSEWASPALVAVDVNSRTPRGAGPHCALAGRTARPTCSVPRA